MATINEWRSANWQPERLKMHSPRQLVGSCFLAVACAMLPCSGCGRTGTHIEGKVAFGGQPVAAGSIAFVPLDSSGQPFGDSIVNGAYKVDPKRGPAPGKYKVEVRWPKPTGKKVKAEDGAMQDDYAESLPKKFHDQTTLTAEVKTGLNKLDFDLKP